jgi:endo-1,3(4)-beta-glucanase
MLPIGPASAYTRTANFVQEEWQTYFANGVAEASANGWRGILMSNLAIIDPRSSWNYFRSSSFDYSSLDGGASRTWYLAYAAALGRL